MAAVNPGVYKDILRVREAYVFDIGGFLMRFYGYMSNIGIVTMLTLSGYSFFTAGLISSTVAISMFFISPRVSKLVDEYGQSHIVPLAALVTLIGLAGLLTNVCLHGPTWLLFASAFLMGFLPSPQALVRTRWTYLIRTGRLGDRAPDLRTMFSYEGVLDDIGFMFSPSISIALASALTPIAGLLAGGISFALGVAILTLSKSTEPTPGWVALDEDGNGNGKSDKVTTKSIEKESVHHKSVFRTSSVVRVLFVLMMLVGAFFGIFDTATVSMAEDLGDPNIAGFILVVASCISMVVGFVFGMINLRVPQYVQLLGCAAFIGCTYGTMMFIDSGLSLFIVSNLGALSYAPFLIVANATVERAVPGDRLTEAITWLNAGVTCGLAFGPSLGGIIIDEFGTVASFDVGGCIALLVPLTAFLCRGMLKKNVRDHNYEEVALTSAKK